MLYVTIISKKTISAMGCGHCDPKASIGQHVSSLPTPALVLSKQVMERNCARMIDKVTQKRWLWRPHVKTLKVGFCFRSKPCCAVQK